MNFKDFYVSNALREAQFQSLAPFGAHHRRMSSYQPLRVRFGDRFRADLGPKLAPQTDPETVPNRHQIFIQFRNRSKWPPGPQRGQVAILGLSNFGPGPPRKGGKEGGSQPTTHITSDLTRQGPLARRIINSHFALISS